MGYAVVLYFDDEASAKIEEIRSELKKNEISIDEGIKPHLSLAVYDDLPIPDFEKEFREYAEEVKSFPVVFSHVGEFPTGRQVLFLEPKITPELLETHKRFHACFSKYNDLAWAYYRPGMWWPHCTLCLNLTEEMYRKAKELLKGIKLPVEARAEKIGLVEFSPHKELVSFSLR